jgi:PIN domain nuclease of toxin-antitoxin system
MVINEITWKIVPAHLEGAGFFAIRLRAEVEVRRLLLEIKRLEADNALLRLKLGEHHGDPFDPNAVSHHEATEGGRG